MTFKKVSAKEWKKMGLPSSNWTISFGPPRVQKPSFVLGPIKKQSFVPDLNQKVMIYYSTKGIY